MDSCGTHVGLMWTHVGLMWDSCGTHVDSCGLMWGSCGTHVNSCGLMCLPKPKKSLPRHSQLTIAATHVELM